MAVLLRFFTVLAVVWGGMASAATLRVTLDQDQISGNEGVVNGVEETTLTLYFATNLDHTILFSGGDLIWRVFGQLDRLGPPALRETLGAFPVPPLTNVGIGFVGNVSKAGAFILDSAYVEGGTVADQPSVTLQRVSADHLSGALLWEDTQGFEAHFYVDSFEYDPFATRDNFPTPDLGVVPLPASWMLLIMGMLGLAAVRRLKA